MCQQQYRSARSGLPPTFITLTSKNIPAKLQHVMLTHCVLTPQVLLQSNEDVTLFRPQSCEMASRSKSPLTPARRTFMRWTSKSGCQVLLFTVFTDWMTDNLNCHLTANWGNVALQACWSKSVCRHVSDPDHHSFGLLNTTRKVRVTHPVDVCASLWKLFRNHNVSLAPVSMWSRWTSRRKCAPTETWTTSWPRPASSWTSEPPLWTRSWGACWLTWQLTAMRPATWTRSWTPCSQTQGGGSVMVRATKQINVLTIAARSYETGHVRYRPC